MKYLKYVRMENTHVRKIIHKNTSNLYLCVCVVCSGLDVLHNKLLHIFSKFMSCHIESINCDGELIVTWISRKYMPTRHRCTNTTYYFITLNKVEGIFKYIIFFTLSLHRTHTHCFRKFWSRRFCSKKNNNNEQKWARIVYRFGKSLLKTEKPLKY